MLEIVYFSSTVKQSSSLMVRYDLGSSMVESLDRPRSPLGAPAGAVRYWLSCPTITSPPLPSSHSILLRRRGMAQQVICSDIISTPPLARDGSAVSRDQPSLPQHMPDILVSQTGSALPHCVDSRQFSFATHVLAILTT